MKPGLFSFIGDEFENIFQYSDLFLPGIEKIAAVYYSKRDRQLKIMSRHREAAIEYDFAEVLQKRENMVMIQKYRAEYHQFAWIKKSDLPFELSSRQKLAIPTIFTELENVVLVLRFGNETDKLYDLLLLYFNQNLGNFGLSKSDKVLTADNKLIIGHLLYYQFKSFLDLNRANRKLLGTFNNGVRSVIHENLSLRDQLNQIKTSYGENIVNIALQHLQKLSVEFGRNYTMSDESIIKIREFKGNLKHLPVILENAIVFTENLLMTEEAESVSIQPYSIDFESYQVFEKTEQLTRKIDSRLSRAMQLLDRLERAASILKGRNTPVISSKVGQAMEPPVSAPAITDSLGKNRELISQLLEKYPEKWEIIRREFKPLLNQLRKSHPDIIKEESA
ncbi:MAG: hypothetical protein MUC31_05845 [Bacteroidales bacterium]|jgi:hypothetical protein|nr:hypothetical protein [Bacteroidales bacterium]